jgi:hypothetical protein
MVDYTERERRKTERERERERERKGKCFTSPAAHHREKKFCVRKKKLNFYFSY